MHTNHEGRGRVGLVGLLVFALAAGPVLHLLAPGALAAVTSQSCPGGRTAHAHSFQDTEGEDWNDFYETLVQESLLSRVEVSSSWTCTGFQRHSGVDELIFTSTLRANAGVGGSELLSRGCGQLAVTDLSTGGRQVREERVLIARDNEVVCDWGHPTTQLVSGRSYLFEVSATLTYDWEAPAQDTTYPFRAIIEVHAEVPNGANSLRNHPICYRTIPGLPCGLLPV